MPGSEEDGVELLLREPEIAVWLDPERREPDEGSAPAEPHQGDAG